MAYAPTTIAFPDTSDMSSNDFPGAAASLAVSGGRPHVQGARGHFRTDRKELLVELWAYPGRERDVSLRACEMAVYAWKSLPKDWTVRCVMSRRPMGNPWTGKRKGER